MRYLCLVAFICIHICCRAQEKEVRISDQGVRSNVGKDDVLNPIKSKAGVLADSMARLDKRTKAIDSLRQLSSALQSQRVFSQKQWQQLYDSLSNIPSVNVPPVPDFFKKEISREELVDEVNKKFSALKSRDTLSSNIRSKTDSIGQLSSNAPTIPKNAGQLLLSPELKNLKLPSEELMNLAPMPASVVKTKYIKALDSIRRVNLGKEKLQLKEMQKSAEEKVSTFREKPDFRERSYFEGVIGFTVGDFKTVQLSPVFGFHLTDYFSLGAGPNLTVRQEDKKVIPTLGLKTLMKIEFLKRKVYLQGEDIMDSYGLKTSNEERRSIFKSHNIFVGGGYLLSMKFPLTLNLSMLYCVTENKLVSYQYSPFVFRIGLSSLKLTN